MVENSKPLYAQHLVYDPRALFRISPHAAVWIQSARLAIVCWRGLLLSLSHGHSLGHISKGAALLGCLLAAAYLRATAPLCLFAHRVSAHGGDD